MDKLNKFFRKVYTSPAMMWKGCAALIFITIGIAVIAVPSLTGGGEMKMRLGFGGLITVYGFFRLWTFYLDYKVIEDE